MRWFAGGRVRRASPVWAVVGRTARPRWSARVGLRLGWSVVPDGRRVGGSGGVGRRPGWSAGPDGRRVHLGWSLSRLVSGSGTVALGPIGRRIQSASGSTSSGQGVRWPAGPDGLRVNFSGRRVQVIRSPGGPVVRRGGQRVHAAAGLVGRRSRSRLSCCFHLGRLAACPGPDHPTSRACRVVSTPSGTHGLGVRFVRMRVRSSSPRRRPVRGRAVHLPEPRPSRRGGLTPGLVQVDSDVTSRNAQVPATPAGS